MADNINLVVQDGNVLLLATKNHQTELAEFGVTEEEVQNLETSIGNLESKDTAHKEAMNRYHQKTNTQKEAIIQSQKAIWKVREIAKGVYRGNKALLKEFNIGKDLPTSVSEALNELVYIKEVATNHKTDLQARGLKDADLTALETRHNELAAADSDQENALRLQTAAMSERTAVLNDLKALMYRIRKSANVCFADNPDVLKEFKSIIPRSKSTKKADTETSGTTEPTT